MSLLRFRPLNGAGIILLNEPSDPARNGTGHHGGPSDPPPSDIRAAHVSSDHRPKRGGAHGRTNIQGPKRILGVQVGRR